MGNLILERCPFCGSDSISAKYNGSRYNRRYYFIECDICGARTRGEGIKNDILTDEKEWDNDALWKSVSCWNQRAVKTSA